MKRYAEKARKLVLAAALLAVPAFSVVPVAATTACFGRDCDQVIAQTKPEDGFMLDEDTWESNKMDGDWMDFGGDHIWRVSMAKLGGRQPDTITGYVSSQQQLVVKDGSGNPLYRRFTPAGGNTFEISEVTNQSIIVHNLTCAQYYLRLVVHAPPFGKNSTPDAGADTGASLDAAANPDGGP